MARKAAGSRRRDSAPRGGPRARRSEKRSRPSPFWRVIMKRVIIGLLAILIPTDARFSRTLSVRVSCLTHRSLQTCPMQSCTRDTNADTGAVIIGRVTDGGTHRPIIAATVLIDRGSRSRRTGASGAYRFSHVSPGSHRIAILASGYLSSERSVTVNRHGMTIIDVVLLRSPKCDPSGAAGSPLAPVAIHPMSDAP